MGKRSAAGEVFLGNMGFIQRETRLSMQRDHGNETRATAWRGKASRMGIHQTLRENILRSFRHLQIRKRMRRR